MSAPYPIDELDSLLNACIAFTRDHDAHFYGGNLGGREGVTADADHIRRMLDWISQTDRGLTKNCGIADDKITYFRLGHHAHDMMARGGFAAYLRRQASNARRQAIRAWAPIAISIVAVVISVIGLMKPSDTARTVDALREQVAALETAQAQLERAVAQQAVAQPQGADSAPVPAGPTPVAPEPQAVPAGAGPAGR